MPEVLCLTGLLARSAAHHPDRVALDTGAGQCRYGDLWRAVRHFASRLLDDGLQPGERVAVVLDSGIDWAVACHGALAAGAIAVPLNATARQADLAAWLGHSGACRVVAAHDNAEVHVARGTLPSPPALIPVDAPGSLVERQAATASGTALTQAPADRPAMILYTSGTTGQPKGVLLSHGNLAANTTAIVAYLGLGATDSGLTVLPFHYAYGASVLHSHLAAGARLVVEDNLVYPHRVLARMAAERITGFPGVPSTFALLLARAEGALPALPDLRYITQAGGPMPPSLARRLRTALPGTPLWLMYGQTEATARLTCLPPDRLDDKPGSVGTPIAGTQLAIRRDDGSPADPGESGEIWARGPGIMLGYWRDAEATARVLVDGWLRTGDLGHLDAEGYLYVDARRSDIIKSGAHRISPAAIEDVIMALPGVVEVAVVPAADEMLGEVVRACIVADADAGLDERRVRAHCRAQLAGHQVPRHVDFMAALPKTASGKIRRHQLAQGVRELGN